MFCQVRSILHTCRMKSVLWIPASCAFVLVLSSCGNTGSSGTQQAGTGPFDRSGRYIEEWADNPSKWRKPSAAPSPHELKSDEIPEIATNEQPPQNSNPLVSSSSSPSSYKSTSSKPIPAISQTQVTSKPKTSTQTSASTAAKAKPKPKPVVKAKPKPKATRYVVKSGDSLSAIASRTGSSVSAIKSANGISGTLIRPGQSLIIPKK
jgi:LysM repeat protein